MSEKNDNLISEALKTYKIPPEYIFAIIHTMREMRL